MTTSTPSSRGLARWLLLAVALSLPLASTAAEHAGGSAPAYVLRVDGLACPYCAYGIEKQFRDLQGVTGIDVDIPNGHVIVRVEPGTRFDRATLERTVEDAGFTLRGVVSEPGSG